MKSIQTMLAFALLLYFASSILCFDVQGQNVGISDSAFSNPHPSALLDLQSETRGFLITRLTSAQRDAMVAPPEALMIFNTTTKCLEIFKNGWHQIWCASFPPAVCGNTVTDMDGNTYPTVLIGSQCWFATNLRTTRYNDGNAVARVDNDTSWANATTGSYCWAHYDSTAYAHVYGALYNWQAVETAKLCPLGWHVPTDTEWYVMENFVDPAINDPNAVGYRGTNASTLLKATSGWMSGGNGTDMYGFAGLPGGSKPVSSGWNSPGNTAYWWSATPNGTEAWLRNLVSWDARARRDDQPKNAGFSVRCVKD
jgi:uncharacterized protein (TIGR02145 family)